MNPLFPGESEVDELNKIFKLLGKLHIQSLLDSANIPVILGLYTLILI